MGVSTEEFEPEHLASRRIPTDSKVVDEIEQLLHLDPVKFIDSKKLFISKNYPNLLEYFKTYNVVDVDILLKAWTNLARLFYEIFRQNVLESWSLPAVAQKILLNKYDTKVAPIFTFADGSLNKEVRKHICGGFSGPLTLRFLIYNLILGNNFCSRHVELGEVDEDLDSSVYFNDLGEKYKKIVQYDANSLYPTVMLEEIPTGLGIFLRRDNDQNGLVPELMKTTGKTRFSNISLEWLDMMQGRKLIYV